MIAVLQEAVGCFRKHLLAQDESCQRLFHEAEVWIMADESKQPFSFDHVCDVIGLDAAYVRRLLRQWRDQQLELAGVEPRPVPPGVRVERRERRTFTNEFKAETVRLVLARGRRIRAVARELHLNASLISSWVRKAEAPAGVANVVSQESEHESRLRTQQQPTTQEPGSLAKEIA